MTCKECQSVLEAYFDSELTPDAKAPVAAHIAVCDRCAESYRRFEVEQDFYLRHASSPAVSQAFWSEVFEKAGRPHGRTAWLRAHLIRASDALSNVRLGPLPIAALLIVSIGITAGVMSFLNSRKPQSLPTASIAEQTPEPNAVRETPERELPTENKPRDKVGPRSGTSVSIAKRNRQRPDDLVRDAERKYLTAISLLKRDAERRRSSLDPEELARFDQALAAVDRTIAGTRVAVRAHPNDPVAVQYMLAAYARKVDVLRQMITD